MRLVIREAAAADIDAAERWYEEQGQDLGAELLLALHDTLALIVEHPFACPLVHRDVRRALVRRFPYVVFYRLREDQVIVVGCFHGHRNPRAWRSRE